MKTLNRRNFLISAVTASAGGILVPTLAGPIARHRMGKQVPPNTRPMLPMVTEEGFYTSINGVGMPDFGSHYINEQVYIAQHSLGIGQSSSLLLPGVEYPPLILEAFDKWAEDHPPVGFTATASAGVRPQVALLELILGVAVIAGGIYVGYKLWQWASSIPAPDTNVYR